MSLRSLKAIPLAAICLWVSLLPETQAAVCSILEVHGANGKIGTGFGVQPVGVVPRSGSGDTGADGAYFNPGATPSPICGVVPILPGNTVDVPTFVNQAVEAGVPSVYSNGSIPMTVFQVNRIGAGPMSCEYSADATGKSWQPMVTTLNMLGNFGILESQNVKMTVVATLQAGSRFTGGPNHDMALIRCRAGVNGNCGGCFLAQMTGQVVDVTSGASTVTPQSTAQVPLQLNPQQISKVVAKVLSLAKNEDLLADQKTA